MFSREFWEISKNTLFTEHLWMTASDNSPFFLIPINYRGIPCLIEDLKGALMQI